MDQKHRQLARFSLLSAACLRSRSETKLCRFPFNFGEVP